MKTNNVLSSIICIIYYVHTYIREKVHTYILYIILYYIIVRKFEYEDKLLRRYVNMYRTYVYLCTCAVLYVSFVKILITDSAKTIVYPFIIKFKKKTNSVEHRITMCVCISVWFWSGFKPNQNHTKTIRKPYQAETIPRTKRFLVWYWFGFNVRT